LPKKYTVPSCLQSAKWFGLPWLTENGSPRHPAADQLPGWNTPRIDGLG
jgi:hypothetical protein